ncbi:DUF1161 domain-containing protein [uncultured Methylibium sp.]|uniref:DUF1161 domain-containing protein n=1 Tax=uncultured Methylibium sp. TaxID=381093 RepID=UPI0025CCBCF4|nr:DUF1161 domain-containing protein [uncultured Methylibium sp.]
MRSTGLPIACLAAALLAAVAPGAAAANPAPGNCDALREQIEAKIRASGVASFTLAVVDADAPADGKVVGSCDRGSRRIVYARSTGAAAAVPAASSTSPPASAPARRDAPVLTECKDGTVRYGGDCPR